MVLSKHIQRHILFFVYYINRAENSLKHKKSAHLKAKKKRKEKFKYQQLQGNLKL